MKHLTPWWLAIRAKTLGVSLATLLMGHGLAWRAGALDWTIAGLCALVILSLQISVNLANDYFDARRGIDGPDRLGPARMGASGALPAERLWHSALLCMGTGAATGLYLLWRQSEWHLLPAGLLCLATVLYYSGGRKPLASCALGELSVFLCFGWIGVMGGYYLQLERWNWGIGIAATQHGLLVAAVMLVNNTRDRLSDQSAGKITLAVRLGHRSSRQLYSLLLLAPCALALLPSAPTPAPVLLLPVALYLAQRMLKAADAELNPLLGLTTLLSGLFAALSLLKV